MKLKILILTIIFSMLLTSCSTIGTQQYTYVGDVSKTTNIVGESTHFDYLGFGISSEGYAREYNNAIKDAFNNSPKGTTTLKNVKIFKENKSWPKVIGSMAVSLGYTILLGSAIMAINSYNSDNGSFNASENLLGVGLMVGGSALWGLNTYDFVVVAEPVK